MEIVDKSKRRIPREVITYPSLQAAVEAKLEIARKRLAGVDLSTLNNDKK
jgi:hypothetical protein